MRDRSFSAASGGTYTNVPFRDIGDLGNGVIVHAHTLGDANPWACDHEPVYVERRGHEPPVSAEHKMT